VKKKHFTTFVPPWPMARTFLVMQFGTQQHFARPKLQDVL